MHYYKALRNIMREIAPKVEQLTGLKAPRKYGHPVHPKIRLTAGPKWDKLYGLYRPDTKTIYINWKFICRAKHFDLVKSVIAHEYTHYLQDLHWPRKDWDNVMKLEYLAWFVEQHWVPEKFKKSYEDSVLNNPAYKE